MISRLAKDAMWLAASVLVAVGLVKLGVIHELVAALGNFGWLGVLIAGMFFTSLFTTPPAIAVLGSLALELPLPLVVVVGGLGAMLGDYLIFQLARGRFSADLKYLLSVVKPRRLPAIFRTRLFKFFVPFLGALVIASPLPDELGVALLGAAHVQRRTFLLISWSLNSLGILLIGLVARAAVGS